jgi:hypothetical protein
MEDRRKQVSVQQAAALLNEAVSRTVEAFGLRPFLVGENPPSFEGRTVEGESSFLHMPYGMRLTPIGYWTSSVKVSFEESQQNSGAFMAEAGWSSGDGPAHAALIYRASQAADALNLAFSEFARKYRLEA